MTLMNTEPKVMVRLTLNESGLLCNLMMKEFTGREVPQWMINLYEKLTKANDKLMFGE